MKISLLMRLREIRERNGRNTSRREVCDFDLLLKKILENYSRKEAERILRRNAERVLLKRLTGKQIPPHGEGIF